MKLNVVRPNKRNAATANCARLLLALAIPLPALLFNCAITVSCQQPEDSGERLLFRAYLQQQQAKTNETSAEQATDRGVSNLHLTPDFRSVKLRWNFEHSSSNEPASFRVRYCELTSWNIEIKCRSRELRVASADQRQQQQQDNNHSTVITAPPTTAQQPAASRFAPIDFVRHSDPPLGSLYEAQIYDLRALTNYTFNVNVGRFSHEPLAPAAGVSRGQAGRRLALAAEEEPQALVSGRIETKPFSAEATKCLADVSELVVNTGKYFGGRISVEGSSDPRCTLVGNRTSDQSSYLFRIDHETCGSKTVDGSRIETMVLVHENKDILTHNSARFLVLCNFLQRSFTLRASVSLPKVNGLMAPSKAAVISALPGKPPSRPRLGQSDLSSAASSASSAEVSERQAVMLGSMPGVYRPRTGQRDQRQSAGGESAAAAATQTDASQQLPTATQAARRDANRTSDNSSSKQQPDELDVENNTIEKFPVAAKVAAAQAWQQQRQPKELEPNSWSAGNPNPAAAAAARGLLTSQSSAETTAAGGRSAQHLLRLEPPAPVQVQSRMLFVDRSSQATRLARQHAGHNGLLAGQQVSGASLLVRSSPLDKAPTIVESSSTATTTTAAAEGPIEGTRTKPADLAAAAESPIIMTNNHRVADEYLPVAQTTSRASSPPSDDYSIKYSAVQVGEYSLGGGGSSLLLQVPEARPPALIAEPPPSSARPASPPPTSLQLRARSGRMRSIEHQAGWPLDQQLAAAASSLASVQSGPTVTGVSSSKPSSAWSVSERMGDLAGEPMTTAPALEPASSSSSSPSTRPASTQTDSPPPTPTAVNSSLAHNITSYLLKWSLKTLSNLAKKSLESLIESGNYVNSSEPLPVGSASAEEDGDLRRLISPGSSLRSRSSTTPQPSLPGTSKTSEIRGGNWRNSANPITTTPATAPTVSTANDTRSLQPPEPTKSMLEQQQRPSDEPLLDGFITSNSPLKDDNNAKKAAKPWPGNNIYANSSGASNNRQQQQQHSRPSNYSKSLDFNRSFELARTSSSTNADDGSEIRSRASSKLGRFGHQRQQSLAPVEDGGSRWPIYSAWLLYGLAMLVVLLVGLFLTLWLLSTSQPAHSASTSSPSIARLQPALSETDIMGGCAGENGSRASAIAHDCQLPASRGFRLVKDEELTYHKYDYNKFENYSSGTVESAKSLVAAANANLLLQAANTNKVMRPTTTTAARQHQESARSPATRSSISSSSGGSANTMLVSDEHDCRNSELLYNEHALATSGTNFGESYA